MNEHDLKKKTKGNKMPQWMVLTIALAALLLVIGGVYVAMNVLQAPKPEANEFVSTYKTLLTKTYEDVISLEVKGKQETLTLLKDETSFYVKEHKTAVLDQTQARYAFVCGATLGASDTIEENAKDLELYGLHDPSSVTTVKYKDGTTSVVKIGDPAATGTSYYMQLVGDPNVYLAPQNTKQSIAPSMALLYQLPTMTEPKMEKINHMIVERAGQDPIELVPEGQFEKVSFTLSTLDMIQPVEIGTNGEATTALAEKMLPVSIWDYVAMDVDLAEYGLKEPRARILITDTEGNGYDLYIGDEMDDEFTYCKLGDENVVYSIETSLISFVWDVKAVGLMDYFAGIVYIDTVDRLVITSQGKTYDLSIERVAKLDDKGQPLLDDKGKAKYDETFRLDGDIFGDGGKVFRKAYQVIVGLIVDGLVKGTVDTSNPVLTLDYTRNQEPTKTSISYYEYDIDHYAVEQNGKVQFYIKKDKVTRMLKAMEELRAGTFDPNNY